MSSSPRQYFAYEDPEFGYAALNEDPTRWLRIALGRERLTKKQDGWRELGRIPDAIREVVLNQVVELPSRDLHTLLRALIPGGQGPVGSDVRHFEYSGDALRARIEAGEATEYERRLVAAVLARSRPSPIPDLTWIIDLVDYLPARAVEVARSFLMTHMMVMNDLAIDGVYDAIAVIRLRLASQATSPVPLQVLRDLAPLDLEGLVASLWESMGYDVALTPVVSDGGRDIVASRTEAGSQIRVLIECKQWAGRVDVTIPRQLLGVLASEKAPKAVVIAPGGFTAGPGSADEFARINPQLELIDGAALCVLLAEQFGETWYQRVDRLITRRG